MAYLSQNYSYEKMRKSVELCRKVQEADKEEQKMRAFLNTPIMTDEEYIAKEVRDSYFCGGTVAAYIGILVLTILLGFGIKVMLGMI